MILDFDRLHKAALGIPRLKQLKATLFVYAHALPYLAVAGGGARILLVGVLGIPYFEEPTLLSHSIWLTLGLAAGLAVSLLLCLVAGLAQGFAFGPAVCLGLAIAGGLKAGPHAHLVLGFAVGLALGLPAGLALGLSGGLALGLFGGLVGGSVFGLANYFGVGLNQLLSLYFADDFTQSIQAGLAGGLGFITGLARPFYLPLHLGLLFFSRRVGWFHPLHPVFWDFNCGIGFPGLDRLLVLHAEARHPEGLAHIEWLISNYSSQRASALRAKTTLTARATARVQSLTELDAVIVGLPEGDKGYLAQTSEVRARVLAISRQQRFVDSVNRPSFREQATQNLRAEINAFYAQIGGYREPLATEFRKAAEAWLKLADAQLADVQRQRQREPTPQVFQAGDPVQRDAEAFVARLDIYGSLEQEIMGGPGCPSLLLYGRRRLGKSTILHNLDGFLPEPVMPIIISMLDPRAFTSVASLVALLGQEIRRVWPTAGQLGPEPNDLLTFFQFLDAGNARLQADNRRLVLGVDEFEGIDRRIGAKIFSEDLAATLRESVQRHRRITWVFAGSHHFSELPHVRWSSYLVSLRTLELPPFTLEETRLLLSQPLKYSRRKEAQAAVATFGAGFWGDDGMDRIHAEAGGWPHLVQLIASTVVDLCNTQSKERADATILEEALAKSVVSGDSVLAELMLYRSEEYPTAWPYLVGFRTKETQPLPEDDGLRLILKRHLLVKEGEGGQWALRVPLMRRWLRERM